MKVINELFEKRNIGQLTLGILMVIYLLIGYKMPCNLSNFINTDLGKISIIIIGLILCLNLNPIIGILTIFVLYEIIQRARKSLCQGSYSDKELNLQRLAQFAPKQKSYTSPFTINNQFLPITLEQEIISKIAPICSDNNITTKATYTPMLENVYDSSPI